MPPELQDEYDKHSAAAKEYYNRTQTQTEAATKAVADEQAKATKLLEDIIRRINDRGLKLDSRHMTDGKPNPQKVLEFTDRIAINTNKYKAQLKVIADAQQTESEWSAKLAKLKAQRTQAGATKRLSGRTATRDLATRTRR